MKEYIRRVDEFVLLGHRTLTLYNICISSCLGRATVVHERDEFWVNVRSDVLWHCDANRGGRVYSSALVITYGMLVFALWSL